MTRDYARCSASALPRDGFPPRRTFFPAAPPSSFSARISGSGCSTVRDPRSAAPCWSTPRRACRRRSRRPGVDSWCVRSLPSLSRRRGAAEEPPRAPVHRRRPAGAGRIDRRRDLGARRRLRGGSAPRRRRPGPTSRCARPLSRSASSSRSVRRSSSSGARSTLLLLIAFTNVANLLLMQGSARARELSLRTALGAPRAVLIRQLAMESAILGVAGGVAGCGARRVGDRAGADACCRRRCRASATSTRTPSSSSSGSWRRRWRRSSSAWCRRSARRDATRPRRSAAVTAKARAPGCATPSSRPRSR